jgi:aminoglycoside phosphotransferase (APT) family kinase protein
MDSGGFGLPPGVEAVVGARPDAVTDLTLPWAAATRTVLVTPAGAGPDGGLVVQWSTDRVAIARRLRLGRRLATVAPGLPIPGIVAGDAAAPVPYVVSRFIPGTPGRALLDDDLSARRLGTAVGTLAGELQTVSVRGLRLSRRWGDPARLVAAAGRWLERARGDIGPEASGRLMERIERLPDALGGSAPVFAHGDLAPVNVVVDGGVVVALLDLERARLAHPLFDAAWWTWIIGHHHPERVASAGGAFLEAAGVGDDPTTQRVLGTLGALQCLEILAGLPARAAATRREWAARVQAALERP